MKRGSIRKVMLAMAAVICIFTAFGQQDSTSVIAKKFKPNIAYLQMMNRKGQQGWLLKAGDDSLHLLPGSLNVKKIDVIHRPDMMAKQWRVPVESIRYVSVHPKNSALKGFLIGLGVGASIGALIGYSLGDDEPATSGFYLFSVLSAEEKAAVGAGGLGLVGALVGGVIGVSSGMSITIKGDRHAYQSRLEAIRKRALVQ